MKRRFIKLFGGFFVLVTGLGVIFVTGVRAKWPPVVNAVRRSLRAARPYALKSSGKRGGYASIVRHVGRTTGREYETPVQSVATDDEFAIALPYGPTTDWVQNVVAAGTAIIVHDGSTHRVARPEIVPMSAAASRFSSRDQRVHRLFGVDHCLIVRRVEADVAAEPDTAATPDIRGVVL